MAKLPMIMTRNTTKSGDEVGMICNMGIEEACVKRGLNNERVEGDSKLKRMGPKFYTQQKLLSRAKRVKFHINGCKLVHLY